MEEKGVQSASDLEKEGNETMKPAKSSLSTAAIVLASLATVLALVKISCSTMSGLDIGMGVVSALTVGTGAAYTVYSLIWDVLFLLAPVLVLVALCTRNAAMKKMLIAAMSLGLAIIVLNIVFGVVVSSSGMNVLRYFSILEIVVIAAQSNAVSILFQIIVYGGAFAVFMMAVHSKKDGFKIAAIGFSIVAAVGLVLMIAGLQPYAYSVRGYTFMGYTIPGYGIYSIGEFLSNVLMWAAIAICIKGVSAVKKTDAVDTADEPVNDHAAGADTAVATHVDEQAAGAGAVEDVTIEEVSVEVECEERS